MNEFESCRLVTKRLEMVAATLDHITAELEGPRRLASLLNVVIESGWPPGEYDRGAQVFFRTRLQEDGPAVIGWYNWYAIRRGGHDDYSILMAVGGYFGPPSDQGDVEIGFSVIPAWRNLGYATEMAKILTINAFADRRVRKVIAHVISQNFASCKVLTKCGFRYVGRDNESGNNRFEILRDSSSHNTLLQWTSQNRGN